MILYIMSKTIGVFTMTKFEKIIITGCLGILFFFFFSIFAVTFSRQVLVKRMGIENAFTNFWLMNNAMKHDDKGIVEMSESIDWQEQYPFEETDTNNISGKDIMRSYLDFVTSCTQRIEDYSSLHVFNRLKFVEASQKFDEIIHWDIVAYTEYNGVLEIDDNYFVEMNAKKDMTQHISEIEELSKFCLTKNIPLLYVQAPTKVSKYEDLNVSGVIDFSNQNADDLVQSINNAGVKTLDLRDRIYLEKMHHHPLFYDTDHHWKLTTGLWAAKEVLQYCNKEFGFKADTEKLDISNFKKVLYPEWDLGSAGKKVSLSRARPEDYMLIYPMYDTRIHYSVPSYGIDQCGDISLTYDMRRIAEKDYYVQGAYGVFDYTCPGVTIVENMLQNDGKTILIIGDSYIDSMSMWLSLAEKEIIHLDIREFDGSVHTLINKEKPDLVIVLYYPGSFELDIDRQTHKSAFDFR